MEKYPNDPRVCFDAYFLVALCEREQSSQEQINGWLEALKKAAPDNALGNYLAAYEHLKSGQPELALQELLAARQKPAFTDYSIDFGYIAEEAYRVAGLSEAEAKVAAWAELILPQLSAFKILTEELVGLAQRSNATGDTALGQMALEPAYELGRRLDKPAAYLLINSQVGVVVQHKALEAMDPNAVFPLTGLTAKEQLVPVA